MRLLSPLMSPQGFGSLVLGSFLKWDKGIIQIRRNFSGLEIPNPNPEFSMSNWYTLPETNIFAPENGWLEYDPFLLGPGLFSGAFAVSFRDP